MMSLKDIVEKSSKIRIPENYIRLGQEVCCKSNPSTLPIIDMNKLLSPQHSHSQLLLLHSASKQWGFFQLVNHGVSSTLLGELKHEIEEFFELPLEEKMKFSMKVGEFEGFGTVVRSTDQKLDWGDRFYMITNPLSSRKPHLLPLLPPSLRNTLESYLSEMKRITMTLLRMMAKGLGMEVRKMEELFEDGLEGMRMAYYPPCPMPELVVGLRPHSDGAGLTILNQINGVDGLQVKKDGIWFPVSFSPGALVVNIGDILEIMSNGVYKSIEHRVTVNSEKGRISAAVFYSPRIDAKIGPKSLILNPNNPPLFKTISMQDFFKEFFTQSFDGKSLLDKMKLIPTIQHNSST